MEGLGARSFRARARSAVILAGRDDVSDDLKTAALMAVLRHENCALVRWAVLWSLQRCGREGADVLGALGDASSDPILRFRARLAAESIRARLAEDE